MNLFGALLSESDSILNWIRDAASDFVGIFSDIDFSILYDWLPSDISSAITACITVFLFLALIALVKRVILFFG